jgi:hypothetical protein
MTIDNDNEGHCLAIRGGVLVDPRAPDPYGKSLDTIDIVGAVFVAPPHGQQSGRLKEVQ